MVRVDELLSQDQENTRIAVDHFRDFDPRLFEIFDTISGMHDAFARCVGQSNPYGPLLEHLSRLASKMQLSSEELAVAVKNPQDRRVRVRQARTVFNQMLAENARGWILFLIQRHFLWAATDLRRLRRTSALWNVRLQVEGVGLLIMFRNDWPKNVELHSIGGTSTESGRCSLPQIWMTPMRWPPAQPITSGGHYALQLRARR